MTLAVGTRVRVTDRRPYIDGRTGTVSTCPDSVDTAPPVVVDLDEEWGGVSLDWHFDEDQVVPL